MFAEVAPVVAPIVRRTTGVDTESGEKRCRGVKRELGRCRFCGSEDHFFKRCPEVACYSCEEKGHIARKCKKAR